MPLFNFQPQFAADVESGKKRQTIRARRKNRPKAGQTAYLYTGTRTKACRKLGKVKIKSVEPIYICNQLFELWIGANDYGKMEDLNRLAKEDGFEDWFEMRSWFKKTHGLPFHGDLIKW